jgi:hypothetical protein
MKGGPTVERRSGEEERSRPPEHCEGFPHLLCKPVMHCKLQTREFILCRQGLQAHD